MAAVPSGQADGLTFRKRRVHHRRHLPSGDPGGDGLDEGDHERDLLTTPAEPEADEHRDRGTEEPDGQDRLLADP